MLTRFLYEQADASLIDGRGIQPDPELAARNLERAREVIKAMGPLWCCYLPKKPRFEKTYCSQCGGEFGPGNNGYSHCADHAEPANRNAEEELFQQHMQEMQR